jgi:hypothetical protein
VLSMYTVPAEWLTKATCLTSSRCNRAGTISSQTLIRVSMATGVEPPKAGLNYAQLESLSALSAISGIPINAYDPYAAVFGQLVKIQQEPSGTKHWTDEEDNREADVIEIRRR